MSLPGTDQQLRDANELAQAPMARMEISHALGVGAVDGCNAATRLRGNLYAAFSGDRVFKAVRRPGDA